MSFVLLLRVRLPVGRRVPVLDGIEHTSLLSPLRVVQSGGADAALGMVVKQAENLNIRCLCNRRGDAATTLEALLDSSAAPPQPLEDGPSDGPSRSGGDAVVATDDGDRSIVAFDPGPTPSRLDALTRPLVLTIIAMTTDAGSDEAGARRMLHTMFAREPKALREGQTADAVARLRCFVDFVGRPISS